MDMKRFLVLTLLLLPLLAGAQQRRDTLVAGGDGYRLLTHLYLPEGEGPWPVIVYRTPYFPGAPEGEFLQNISRHLERGIGFVFQHCRGTGGSEGVYEPNIYDREDGLALLRWLQEASWCKSIGLTGCSYMGLTSWIVADALPSKVKGIYLEHYGIDRHLSAYCSGLFRQDILTAWAIGNAAEVREKPTFEGRIPFEAEMRHMPQVTMDTDLLGAEIPWYRDWISHTDYTDPYWHSGFWELLRSIPPKIQVPMTVVAGHFDHHLEGTLLGYNLLPEETKSRSRLIVGGWDHNFVTTPLLPGIVHDKDLNVDRDALEWFYSLLVEEKEPVHEVKVYAIGADRWESLEEWPVEGAEKRTLYLSGEFLSEKPSCRKKALEYDYDPTDPVISVGGETLFSSNALKGSRLQEPVGYRDDILFFRSAPLEEPLVIASSPVAHLWVSSDCEDTAFSVKISEERPDGSTYNIRTGIATLAYRKDKLGPRGTYQPGEIVELRIEMLPVLWQLQKGSRIRVDISSSDFPQYSIHSNCPGVWSEQKEVRTAREKVWTGRKYPSSISL